MDRQLKYQFAAIFVIGAACIGGLLYQLRSKGPYRVTYTVSRVALTDFEMEIMYADETGCHDVVTKEKRWTKEVCLPEYHSAFVFVHPKPGSKEYEEERLLTLCLDDYDTYFAIRMECEDRHILSSNNKFNCVVWDPAEPTW